MTVWPSLVNAASSGVRFNGGNITANSPAISGQAHPWALLQAGWTSLGYWTSWVKPNIDAANTAGLNAVRLILDLGGIYAGTFTLASELANLTQLLNYCRSIGMKFYPCFGAPTDFQGADLASIQSYMVAFAQVVANYPDVVVGIDLLNEVNSSNPWGASTAANTQTLYNAVKPLVGAIPITASGALQTGFDTAAHVWGAPPGSWGFLDFYDFHAYYTIAANDPNPSKAGGKPIMMGEYGDPTEPDTNPNIVTVVNAAITNAANTSGVTGAFFWVIAYTGVGMYDSSFNAQATVVAAVQAGKKVYP